MDEAAFRELLDERGILRDGALRPPPRSGALTVFAQAPHPVLDVAALKHHATRFFAAKIGITVEKRYGAYPPETDAARVVLAAGDAAGTRLCFGRRATDDDLGAAERADAGGGMALLAQRCPTVWLVASEAATDQDDRVALTIAAIFASVMLGPILSHDELFGVRTARSKLEGRPSPYR